MEQSIQKLQNANRLLSEVRTISDAKNLADKAAAAEMYARKAKLGLEAQNHAAEIKIRAERMAGKMLADLERGKPRPGGRTASIAGHGSEYRIALDNAEATRQDANRWQQTARMPDPDFERWVSEKKIANEEITTGGLLSKIRKDAGLSTLQSSESNEWYTPTVYADAARWLMGSIDLDPASCEFANKTIKAAKYFDEQDDGLSQKWNGNVWLNPPYGRSDEHESNQGIWSRAVKQKFDSKEICQAVLLVNAVTDRSWFRPLWEHHICFVGSRIKFLSENGSSPSPTHGNVLVYFGDDIGRFVDKFSVFGRCVIPKGRYGEAQ